ncbi:MAG: hypothetical protein ABL930_02715 [Pseudobdellovibrio sp.]
MKLNLWISLPLSMICVLANAQGTASTTTTTATTTAAATAAPAAATSTATPKKEEAPSFKFGLSYDAEYALQAQTQPDGTRSQGLSNTFTGSMGYGQFNSFLSMTYDQDLIDSSGSAWGDAALGVSKKAWTLGEYLKLGPSMSLALPLTDATRNVTGLQYAVGGTLKLTLVTKALGMDNFSISQSVGVTKFFTNFDTTSTGSPSKAYRLRNQTSLGYSLTDSLSIEGLGRLDSNYSVNGVVTNFFILQEAISYQINDNVSVGASHTNAANYLNSKKEYESNLKFYDSESSSYSVNISVSL